MSFCTRDAKEAERAQQCLLTLREIRIFLSGRVHVRRLFS